MMKIKYYLSRSQDLLKRSREILIRNLSEGRFFDLLKKIFIKVIPEFIKFFWAYIQAPTNIPKSKDYAYRVWLANHHPRPADLRTMLNAATLLPIKPLISIIIVVLNPNKLYLKESIESVFNQVYLNWELCIVYSDSTRLHLQGIIEEFSERESRIKFIFKPQTENSADISNFALSLVAGDFVIFLEQNDLLTPDALYEIALLLNHYPDADMIYSDEDKIDDLGYLLSPYFKPDWCPDSFLSTMYTNRLAAYRRSLMEDIGGFRSGYEGAQDYDLVLRFTEKTQRIFHIPKILYHGRINLHITTSEVSTKLQAIESSVKAISEAVARRGEPGNVIVNYHNNQDNTCSYIVRYHIPKTDLVSIIIPTRDLGRLLDKCLRSIFTKSTYPNYEVIIIDNGSQEDYTFQVFRKWLDRESSRFKIYTLDIPFNYSKLNNLASQQAQGKYLLFLNNDIEVITKDWLEAMVEQAQRSTIGCVGTLLLYPDRTIQHAGLIAGLGGIVGTSHKHRFYDEPGYFGRIKSVTNYSALTGACLMCKHTDFDFIHGFDENLAVAYNDVDLCFRMIERGLRNVYLPHVALYHFESKSRGYVDSSDKYSQYVQEFTYLKNRWQNLIDNDPCYNPNLSREQGGYRIALE